MTITIQDIQNKIRELQQNNLSNANSLREEIVLTYTEQTLSRIENAFAGKENLTEGLKQDLQHFLEQNWNLVQGTTLCYTALPEHPLTLLICDIANLIASDNNALDILMPGVKTESMDDRYPSLETLSLPFILKTYIYGSGGYLFPVTLLAQNNSETIASPQPLFNPYYDFHDDEAYCKVSEEQYQRLVNHSLQTRNIFETRQHYESYFQEQNHLLGHLRQLCASLYFNSVAGVGEETVAGEGAYTAIIKFSDYYKNLAEAETAQIPPPVKMEIERLFTLASDSNLNTSNSENIATCIASRRHDLLNAIKGHENALSQIALTGEDKKALEDRAELAFKDAQSTLEQEVRNGTYSGADILPITRVLLQALNLRIRIETYEDLSIFNTLQPEEVTELLNSDPHIQHNIIALFNTLEDWVLFCESTHPAQLAVFLESMAPALTEKLILQEVEDQEPMHRLAALLIFLDVERCQIICQALKNNLVNAQVLDEGYQVVGLLQPLNAEQIITVFDTMQDAFPHWHTPGFIGGLFSDQENEGVEISSLNVEQKRALFESVQKILPYIRFAPETNFTTEHDVESATELDAESDVESATELDAESDVESAAELDAESDTESEDEALDGFVNLIIDMNREQRQMTYNLVKHQLFTLNQNAQCFKTAINSLVIMDSDENFAHDGESKNDIPYDYEQCAIYDAMEDDIPRLIQTTQDFAAIFSVLYPHQKAAIIEKIKDNLTELIKTPDDFIVIAKELSIAEVLSLYLELKITIPELEQGMRHILSSFPPAVHRFVAAITPLAAADRTAFFNAFEPQIRTMLYDENANGTSIQTELFSIARLQFNDELSLGNEPFLLKKKFEDVVAAYQEANSLNQSSNLNSFFPRRNLPAFENILSEIAHKDPISIQRLNDALSLDLNPENQSNPDLVQASLSQYIERYHQRVLFHLR